MLQAAFAVISGALSGVGGNAVGTRTRATSTAQAVAPDPFSAVNAEPVWGQARWTGTRLPGRGGVVGHIESFDHDVLRLTDDGPPSQSWKRHGCGAHH